MRFFCTRKFPFVFFGSLVLLFAGPELAYSQNIPVTFPLLNDYLRRQQVLGEQDAEFSFNYRPINVPAALENASMFEGDSVLMDFIKPVKIKQIKNEKLKVSLLPAQITQVYNSSHPYGWGEGPILSARGFQHLVEAGVHASYGLLSVQFYPQFFHARNNPFPEYNADMPDLFFERIHRFVGRIDQPVRHGNRPITRLLPGNSHIKVNFGAFAAGISTENLWWGPGQHQALLISDNAEGFLHGTIQTTKPAKTAIGNFEGQYFMGRVDDSGYSHYSDRRDESISRPLLDDWRYFTGISVSYSPKWIDGLSLGFSRSFMLYSEKLKENGLNGWFPHFEGLQKENVGLVNSRDSESDQLASVFARWYFTKIKAEIYGEFIRTDHPLNWRELVLNPEHARGYILGVSKYFSLPNSNVLHVNLEMTQTENSINNLVKWDENSEEIFHAGIGLYENYQVRHGHTQRGQIIGSGLGHSGNLSKVTFSKIKGLNKIGLSLERLARNMNYHNFAKANGVDVLRWVDLGLGGHFDHRYENYLLSVTAKLIRSHNYNYAITEYNALGPAGDNMMNFYSKLKLAYFF